MIAILSFIVIIPLATLVVYTAGISFSEFIATVTRPRVLASYYVSISTSLVAALINAVMGLILAWILVRFDFPGKKIVDGIIELPFALPTAVAGISITHLTVTNGWVGSLFAKFGIEIAYTRLGITIALIFIGIPFVVRSVQPVLEKIDGEYEEAAEMLGTGKLRIFWKVIFPEIFPALMSGFTLAFARSIGEYGSVVFIAGNTPYETEITPLLIIISMVFLAAFLILPLVYIVVTVLREGISTYVNAISDEYAVKAIILTIKTTVIAVVVNTVFGLCAAWCVTKFSFKGKKVVSTLIDLPVTVSPIIAGLIYVLLYGRQSFLYPFLHEHDIDIIFAVPGVVLATIFVTFPFISREVIPVLNAQGTDEEEAAALMGAKTFTIFRKITLPHAKWALLYGIVLCTARAMGEFGAVSVLSVLVIMAIVILILRSILEHLGKKQRKSGRSIMSEKIKNYVELKHIEKSFGKFHASKDINISIEQGKRIALLGPSGSGKTTILKMIAGLETPDSGDIYINGKKVEVDVFIYRLYVIDGDKIVLVDNESLNGESVVI